MKSTNITKLAHTRRMVSAAEKRLNGLSGYDAEAVNQIKFLANRLEAAAKDLKAIAASESGSSGSFRDMSVAEIEELQGLAFDELATLPRTLSGRTIDRIGRGLKFLEPSAGASALQFLRLKERAKNDFISAAKPQRKDKS